MLYTLITFLQYFRTQRHAGYRYGPVQCSLGIVKRASKKLYKRMDYGTSKKTTSIVI